MKIENGVLSEITSADLQNGHFAIPNDVNSIGNYAFYGCTSLTSVNIGNSVTSIGNNAFSRCTSLTSITIPDSVTAIKQFAFFDCTSLTNVIIGNSVTYIGQSAFSGCEALTSITIPDSVTAIKDCAFHNCTSLMNVIIGNSVTYIGFLAFYRCFKLKKKGSFKATNAFMYCINREYEIGKWYEEDEAILCQKGFHYCEDAFDLFNHYSGQIGEEVRFFEIEAEDISQERSIEDSKRVCKKIKFVREIKSYKELLN